MRSIALSAMKLSIIWSRSTIFFTSWGTKEDRICVTRPRKSWRPVTIPNAEHLLDQAERLIAPGGRGAPRQVDLRRAISNSYYALFHAVSMAGADQFIG